MAKTRLMNRPADYEQLGIKPNEIELWEDGRRIKNEKGWWEWWYFDSILDDGTRAVVQFFTKSGGTMNFKHAHPKFTMRVTLPDGTERSEEASFKESEATWSYERCGVDYDGNLFDGNYEDYTIRVKPINGTGVDFTMHSLSRPYRPGSSYFELGEPGRVYTWLCAVPKGEVTGTITVDGQTRDVHGYGYHDHQWGNTIQYEFLNHWLWARQSTENHTLAVFDFILNENYGFKRIPFVFLQDLDGNLLFSSTDNVECTIEEELFQEASQVNFPKITHYLFRDGDKTLDYTLTVKDELDGRNVYKEMPFFMRGMFDGTKPKYGRYLAEGRVTYSDGTTSFTEASDLIYEFAYVGDEYRKYAEIPLIPEEK